MTRVLGRFQLLKNPLPPEYDPLSLSLLFQLFRRKVELLFGRR